MKLTWDKRYITLAPVATVLGLAFKMYDPDGLLGGERELGVTCALIPTDTPGCHTGRRHFPASCAVPERADLGQRRIRAAGLHHRRARDDRPGLAHADGMPVGRALDLAALGLDRRCHRQCPAHRRLCRDRVVSSISRSANSKACRKPSHASAGGPMPANRCAASPPTPWTWAKSPRWPRRSRNIMSPTMAQQVAKDAMDVHAGKAVMLGPSNPVARDSRPRRSTSRSKAPTS